MSIFGSVSPLSTRSHALARSMAVIAGLCAVPTTALAFPLPLGGGGVLITSNAIDRPLGLSNSCFNFGAPTACSAAVTTPDVIAAGSDPALFIAGSGPLDAIRDVPVGVGLPLTSFQTVQSPLGEVFFDLLGFVMPAVPPVNNCNSFALNATCAPGGGSPFL